MALRVPGDDRHLRGVLFWGGTTIEIEGGSTGVFSHTTTPNGASRCRPPLITPLRRSKLRQSLTGSSSRSCCIVFTSFAILAFCRVAKDKHKPIYFI